MRVATYFMLCLALISCTTSGSDTDLDVAFAEAKSSPFSSFDFTNDKVLVGLDGETYQLLKMDTVSVSFLLESCQDIFQEEWIKRFSEDFVELLQKLDIQPRATETFSLIDPQGNTISKAVTFTAEKRKEAQDHYDSQYEKDIQIEQILTKLEMEEDIDFLHSAMQKRYSYYQLPDLDVPAEISRIKEHLPESMSVFDFSLVLSTFINKFGDGHSRVRNVDYKELGILPFQTSPFQGKVICHQEDQLVDKDHPYLVSINNVSLDKLLAQSEQYFAPQGADHFIESSRVRRLSRIGVILKALDAYQKDLEIVLTNDNGHTISKRMQMTESKRRSREDNPFTVKMLESNIGYIKIDQMSSSDPASQVEAVMTELAEAEAFVIDVRDNGGGSRSILLNLLPYFISDEQNHLIGNVAFLRNDAKTGRTDYLEDRYLYPYSSEEFSDDVRQQIDAFMQGFEIQHNFDRTRFTEPHFLYIPSKGDQQFQNKAVAVLLNGGCFSATDIFLSSFDQLTQATLIGTKSGGGSGRARDCFLPKSAIELSLSSIMSLQGNGHLFDGRGVYPDLEVPPATINDVIGSSDNQLDYAVEYLLSSLNF